MPEPRINLYKKFYGSGGGVVSGEYIRPEYDHKHAARSWRPQGVYQLKYSLLHDRAEPHHFVSTKGGQSCPPRRACLTTSLRRDISPMPHDLLQGLHWDQSLTRQSRGGPVTQVGDTVSVVVVGIVADTCVFS